MAARDAGGLGDFERLILQQAVTVVALELMRQRAMRDTERRLAGDVLAEALTGRLSDERAGACGCGRSASAQDAAVLVFAGVDGDAAPQAEADLDRFLADAGRGRARAPRASGCCARWSTRATDVDPVALAGRAREALADEPRRRCAPPRRAPRRSARCGARSTRRAARSRRRALANGGAPPVASYRDLGAFQLLLSLQDDDALRLYCDSVLGPLEDASGEYGDELMRSLEAFIEQNGQWERAARELYCHRHTLRYRDQAGRAADRARPVERARPDRVLAGATCTSWSEGDWRPMKVGVPTEIKTDEYRVSLTPAGVRELVEHGHEVIVQSGAGEGSTIPDEEYAAQGARIVPDAAGGVRRGRDGARRQGAAAAGGRDAAPGPHAVHLPAPRARPRS